MNTLTSSLQRSSSWSRSLVTLSLAAGAWALSGIGHLAHASDVSWSVGVHVPGVTIGVSNADRVVVNRPASSYYRPAVVVAAAPVYPVYVAAPLPVVRPVVYAAPVVVHGHRRHHHRHWR